MYNPSQTGPTLPYLHVWGYTYRAILQHQWVLEIDILCLWLETHQIIQFPPHHLSLKATALSWPWLENLYYLVVNGHARAIPLSHYVYPSSLGALSKPKYFTHAIALNHNIPQFLTHDQPPLPSLSYPMRTSLRRCILTPQPTTPSLAGNPNKWPWPELSIHNFTKLSFPSVKKVLLSL